jgi:hypothetical protein
MKKYIKVTEAAEYLSVDKSFLKKNMGVIFIEKLHFYKPKDSRIVRWNIDALDSWIQGEEDAQLAKENANVLQQLLR